MARPTARPRSTALAWLLLVVGIALIGGGQLLHLSTSQAATAGSSVAADSLAGRLADDFAAPLLRAFGDPDPSPAAVAAMLRYSIFAAMAVGLVLAILGARRLFVARRR